MKSASQANAKKQKKNLRRTMDEEKGRQAQLWWMFGVGITLLISAYLQSEKIIQSQAERVPAQSLPYFQAQSK